MEFPTKQKVAGRAAILHNGKLLVLREANTYVGGSKHGYFDLPGGKVELGESIQDCVRREVQEETGLEITISEPFYVGEWRPLIKGELLQIIGVFFVCAPIGGPKVILSKDHDEYQWINKANAELLPLAIPVPEAVQILAARGLLT